MNTQSSMFQNMQGVLTEKIQTVFILIYNESACQTTPFLHTFKLKKNYRTMTAVTRSYNATFFQIMH